MVSTASFVSVDNASNQLFVASPPKCSKAPSVPKETVVPSFKLHGISVNGLCPDTLQDLIALGKARNCPDAPRHADHVFAGHSEFANDVTYFKALLETRMRMRIALKSNLQSLQQLRAKNNAIIRKRNAQQAARRAAAEKKTPAAPPAAPPKPGAVAIKSASLISPLQSLATTAITHTTPSSAVTVDVGAAVPDTWQVCSSPVSTEDCLDDHHVKDRADGIAFRCGGAPQQNIEEKQAAYRV